MATLVGSVFATWLSARQTRMNTTATFVGLLFFGWIWGLWGILLGIPLLAIVKTICERTDSLHRVAELLTGDEEPVKRPPLPAQPDTAGRNTDIPCHPLTRRRHLARNLRRDFDSHLLLVPPFWRHAT